MTKFISMRMDRDSMVLINKKSFENIVSILPNSVSGIKINVLKTNITFEPDGSNVSFQIEIKIASGSNLKEKVKRIEDEISLSSQLLIGVEPKNIQINCVGIY